VRHPSDADVCFWHKADVSIVLNDVRFSNRPVGVKRFQTHHDSGVNVTRGLVLLYGIGT
jgi:hypothetical protein